MSVNAHVEQLKKKHESLSEVLTIWQLPTSKSRNSESKKKSQDCLPEDSDDPGGRFCRMRRPQP